MAKVGKIVSPRRKTGRRSRSAQHSATLQEELRLLKQTVSDLRLLVVGVVIGLAWHELPMRTVLQWLLSVLPGIFGHV